MALSRKTFAARHSRLLAAVALVLIAFSAVAARAHHHRAQDEVVPADRVQVETSDYLAWHRQEAASVELDSLGGSLRLFATIADKLAADANGSDEFTTVVAHGASPRPAVER